MNDTKSSIEDRIAKAKDTFIQQGHSGMSASLMFAMLSVFSPNGEELVKELKG